MSYEQYLNIFTEIHQEHHIFNEFHLYMILAEFSKEFYLIDNWMIFNDKFHLRIITRRYAETLTMSGNPRFTPDLLVQALRQYPNLIKIILTLFEENIVTDLRLGFYKGVDGPVAAIHLREPP